ncbi:MAG: hypothetical protein JWN15_1625, partial [Firmicutes bacterium]|nr:hypothetical protein [Bacillota bacterium]
MRRILSLAGLVLFVGALLAGCSSGGKSSSATGSSASSSVAKDSAAPATTAPSASPVPGAPPAAGTPLLAAATPLLAAATPLPADRKIIQNAQFDVKVKNSDDAVAHIGQVVRASGGYVQETKQSGTQQQGRTINMTVRVPASQYGSVIDLINGLGDVTQRREWTEDVTEQYVDLEARIKTQQLHLQQLNKLYERSGSIKEMMDLEQEISRVTADLESMQGKIKVLASRVDFSTISVNLYEPGAPAPIAAPRNVWERVKLGFRSSTSGLANFTGDLAVFLAILLPVLAYVLVLGGVGYALYRLLR